ncbi:MAG: hypothetical protein IK094_05120 [Treponema sp.]|nr:hypothetical protein [Treponema sp.]
MIRLAAFLGNVGSAYAKNRHNTAWQFASALPFYGELSWQQKFKGEYAVLTFAEFAEKAKKIFSKPLEQGRKSCHAQKSARQNLFS